MGYHIVRTAQTAVILTGGTRPKSQTAVGAADAQLAQLTDQPPLSPIRFAGYTTAADITALHGLELPAGTRVALYEADYTDPSIVTLAHIA